MTDLITRVDNPTIPTQFVAGAGPVSGPVLSTCGLASKRSGIWSNATAAKVGDLAKITRSSGTIALDYPTTGLHGFVQEPLGIIVARSDMPGIGQDDTYDQNDEVWFVELTPGMDVLVWGHAIAETTSLGQQYYLGSAGGIEKFAVGLTEGTDPCIPRFYSLEAKASQATTTVQRSHAVRFIG